MSCECCYTVYYTDNSESKWEFNTSLNYNILKTLAEIYLQIIELPQDLLEDYEDELPQELLECYEDDIIKSYEGKLTEELLKNIQSDHKPSIVLVWILEFISSAQKEFNIKDHDIEGECFHIFDLKSGECEDIWMR